jgi:mono/diheme cytochrome c family protein
MAYRRRSRFSIVLLPLLMAGGAMKPVAADAEPAAADTSAQSIAAGKALFNSVGCWSCHGFSGQGATSRGIASGPRIDAKVFPREAFFRQLRSPVNVMPPYTTAVLTDHEVAEIYAYLRTIPAPPQVKDIPLLKLPPR